ncbi:metal ABC transporter solute-binding protein, Zn/Mn family [Subtercola frigoramans]|uniref:Zinc/manganese transport system substrate-binding protein n=1 Tax=Subtercola frigoramans TaxID=120298 RepID=A0ABS2L008_9MICO|nr:zinc ABC transporter substrate-binding protein [Subtercola frigoramans]MBM7470408.1 zinc/manganese transport system substrate-binding protein [Subtercola frigoramans]
MSRTRSDPRSSAPLLRLVGVLAAAASVALLSGCASSAAAPTGSGAVAGGSSTISIVASTDVYGDIAAQIGGAAVTVTSIITDPSKDPHEFTADAQNQLAVSKADIVVENGGGYDDFLDAMVASARNPDVVVLNAAAISGKDQQPANGSFNEHLWYDIPTISKLADELVVRMTALAPADSATFSANATEFSQKLAALEATEVQLKGSYAGTLVAITEPVPLYMLDAIGLVNVTPEKFSAAVEGGTDAAPDVVAETEALFTTGGVKLFVYNSQTVGPQTDAVRASAIAAGASTVPVTETLPVGSTYAGWMADTLAALSTALAR